VREVIGVDSSAAMLKAARKRVADLENVDLRRGDLESTPIDSGTCDAALLVLVLSYLSDMSVALREANRILKPGGRLVIIDLLPHDRDDFRRQMNQRHAGFAPESLKSTLTAAGFDNVRIQPLPPEPNAKGPALFQATATKPL
jgi:ArsR family transcriptional regulator